MNPQPTSHSARQRAGYLLALSVLALGPASALGQIPLLEPPALGTHVFQNFLHGLGRLQPLNGLGELATKKPRESVLVVFGDLSCLERMRPGLKEFIAAGGAVLLASDHPDQGRLSALGLRIPGSVPRLPEVVDIENTKVDAKFVWLVPPGGDGMAPEGLEMVSRLKWQKQDPTLKGYTYDKVKELQFGGKFPSTITLTAGRWKKQEAAAYQGLEKPFLDCLVVKGYIGQPHPLFADCTQGIVVDQPSYLERVVNKDQKATVHILCSFPPFRTNVDGERTLLGEPGFVAASDDKANAQQRVVILSGHSLFLNCAIGQRDLDNATFTANTIRWLTDSKERKYCLFVKDDQAVTKFDVPLLLPPMPTSRMINDFLRALEQENFFNRMVVDNIAKNKILRVLVTLSLIGLAIYGFRRYSLARHRQDYNVPLVETKLARLVADFLPPLARRRHHALRSRDFREAARALARESFLSGRGRLPAKPPIPAGVNEPERAALGGAVERLWRIATGQDVLPVTADAFSGIVEQAGRVKTALTRGTLRWQS
jgi:hypothetical protein